MVGYQDSSINATMDQSAMDPAELDVQQLRAIGLGYNFISLQDQVKAVLSAAIKKVLPIDDGETTSTTSSQTPSGRPRYSVETTCAIQLDKTLQNLAREVRPAKEAVAKAEATVQEALDLSKLMDLYVMTLNSIKAAVDSGPDPKDTLPAPVPLRSAPVRSGLKQPTIIKRTTGSGIPSAIVGWKQAANNAIGQNKKKPAKPKASPPKPILQLITEEEFDSVSELVRGRAKLSDVNKAYSVLYNVFYNENLEKIKLSDLAKRGVGVSGMTEKAKLKILRSLKRIVISADENFISPGDI